MTDVTIEGPRLATSEEFPEVLDLVDRCFQRRDGGMADEWAHCYDETNPDQHAVIIRDGHVVANIGCLRQTLKVGENDLEAAGITAVVTDPRYRDNGYMARLLEFWLDRIDEWGIPFAELAGDRTRYGRFGWDNAGQDRRYKITERSLEEAPVREKHARRYDGSEETLTFIRELYASQQFRVVRDEERFRTHLGRGNLATVLYDEPGEESYLTFKRNQSDATITEVVGTDRGVRALLTYVFRVFGSKLESLQARVHPSDPLNPVFGSWSTSNHWRTFPHRKVNVRDLPGVLEAFGYQIARSWRRGEGGDAKVTLKIEGDKEAAELAVSDECAVVRRVANSPNVELGRRAMVRLLFGYPETVTSYEGHPVLEAVLPLEFYLPRTDQV